MKASYKQNAEQARESLKVGDVVYFRFMDHVGVVLKCHWDGKHASYDFAVQYTETLDGIKITDHLRLYNINGKHILMEFKP